MAARFFCLLLPLLVLLQPTVSAKDADLIFLNGVILTVDEKNTVAQAIAVTEGTISAVGTNSSVRKKVGANTQVVDLAGRTVTPGFIDAHGHFLIAGRNKTMAVDLNAPPIGDIENMAQLIERVSERAKKTRKGEWIIGLGYDDTLLEEGRHPTRHDLDLISTEHPVFLFHISLHFAVANTKALEIAGITADTPQPEGGVVHKEKDTGHPTGLLEEGSAFFPAYRKALNPTLAQNLDAANVGAHMYAKVGVTSAQDGAATEETIKVLYEAVRRGMMPIRLTLYPRAPATYKILDGSLSTETKHPEMIRIGATKIIADGSIQGYTGYLRESYHVPYHGDEHYRGYPTMPREKLVELVTDMYKNKRQVAIHGNGDAAIDDILDAVEAANKKYPNPDARPIIIHAQMAQEDQLDRMKDLGVIPSFFSLHTYYWGDRHSSIFMGPERAARMSPTKSALERGIRFTVHCDTPVVPMDPLKLIWATANRVSTGGTIIGDAQRVGVMDAIRATTIDAARQNFEEDTKGSIEVGKYADLVILSEDPRLYPTRIDEIQVLETFVGGKSVFRKN